MNTKRSDVQDHYERWPFPACDFASKESLLILRSLQQLLDPWRGGRPRVLDAGCGTGNTVIALARRFPGVGFLGVDLSERSIRAARGAAQELANLSFERADITENNSGLGQFEVVLCFGALHHTPDMAAALRRLVGRIAPGGRLLLWLYGRYGRARHSLNQAFISSLCVGADPASRFSVAKAFLQHLGRSHAAGTGFYTPHGSGEEGICWLLEHPAWLADQMLPALEQGLTMREILELFAGCELRRPEWLGVSTDLGSYTSSRLLVQRFEALSDDEKLLAIDCLVKPEYYLISGERR